jgi:hypothetical protein
MLKKNDLIPFIIIFIIVAIAGSLFNKSGDPTILDGNVSYGFPFTYLEMNSFTGGSAFTKPSFLILNLIIWIIFSLLITKIVLRIRKKK